MTRSALLLTVRRSNGMNRATLEKRSPNASLRFGTPIIQESYIEVSEDQLQELNEEFKRLILESHVHQVKIRRRTDQIASRETSYGQDNNLEADLKSLGQIFFSQVMPEPVRQQLQTCPPGDLTLRLEDNLIHLPWELCSDGHDFLTERFHVGREVITGIPIKTDDTTRPPRDRLRVLIVADPQGNLPAAAREGKTLCTVLSKVPELKVKLLSGTVVHHMPLLRALENYDVVHFAGHSNYDPNNPEKGGWQLADGVLTAKDVRDLRHPPSLVFSNSCEAGATSPWVEGKQAFGLGSSFLIAGVNNYIGTFWSVHDAASLCFATTFYRSLTAGASLGNALAKAREAVGRDKLIQHSDVFDDEELLREVDPGQAHQAVDRYDLTRFSYVLYGSPAVQLTPTPVGSLRVSVTGVDDAQVTVNSDKKGAARAGVPLVIPDLEAGVVQVTVTQSGYKSEERTITIMPNQEVQIQVELTPISSQKWRLSRDIRTFSVGVALILALMSLLKPSPTPGPQNAQEPPKPPALVKVAVTQLSGGLPAPIQDGEELLSSDQYKIVFDPTEELFIYVILRDAKRELQSLFPDPAWSSQTNPVAPHQSVRIPEDTEDAISVEGPAGEEVVYVLASHQYHRELADLIEDLQIDAEAGLPRGAKRERFGRLEQILDQDVGLAYKYALKFQNAGRGSLASQE